MSVYHNAANHSPFGRVVLQKNWFGGLDDQAGPVREYLWGNLNFCQTFS
jgi:hypothetical protein